MDQDKRIAELEDELARMTRWKDDLLDGCYVNCVYCGHRYPPGTPESQAEILKEHIRSCPAHPMRALEEENKRLKLQLAILDKERGTRP